MNKWLLLIAVALASAAPAMAVQFTGELVSPVGSSLAASLPQASPQNRPPGLYVQVLGGLVSMQTPSGATNLAAGQFGFSPNLQQAPVILPSNPGMQFTAPPVFSNVAAAGQASTPSAKPGAVDCEVR